MKINGAEATEFYESDWDAITGIPGFNGELADGWLTLGGEIVDDDAGLDPETKYTIEGTYYDPRTDKAFSVTTLYRRWKLAQTHVTLKARVPIGQVDDFKALCKERGWRL